VEGEPGNAEPEVFGDCHKLLEGWDRKAKLVEEVDFEERCHVGKKRFQVSADARKGKPAEVRKCDVSYDPLERYFPPDIAVRRRGTEANLKCLELRQERERAFGESGPWHPHPDGWLVVKFYLFNLCCPQTCWIV